MIIVSITHPIYPTMTLDICARSENARTGFRHVAETTDGTKATVHYLNRTWEFYRFQTVLHELLWKVIKNTTGLNPKTKRDGEAFQSLYRKATNELDAKISKMV